MWNSKLSKGQIEEMCKLYETGKYNFSEIGKLFQISPPSARGYLHRRNYKKNTARARTYPIIENFFEELNENSMYVLGLLYADGYVSKDRNTVSLSLKETDKPLLEIISGFVQPNKPLQYIKQGKRSIDKPMWRLNVESEKIKNDLIKLGCRPNKTLFLTFPSWLPTCLESHFVRGYFDGDGSLSLAKSINSWRISFLGTQGFLNSLGEVINRKLKIKTNKLQKTKSCGIFQLSYSGIKCEKICDWLYQDASLFLERKFSRYKEISQRSAT